MDVAMRDAMVPEAGTPEFFRGVKAIGVDSIEVEVARDLSTKQLRRPDGTPYSLTDYQEVDALRRRLGEEGLRVCAFLVATDFTAADAETVVDWAAAVCRRADEMGVPAVRIDPLSVDKSMSREEALTRLTWQLGWLLERTDGLRPAFGIENHGPFANDPDFLDRLLEVDDTGRLGLTLDTGNFYWFGFPLDGLYGLIEKYAPRVKHTHVKNINYPPQMANVRREVGVGYKEYCCALDEGNIDLARVVRILRGAGYDRDLCIENESLFKHPTEKRAEVLRRDVAAVRAAMQ
jgi:sugar phosphate isomerase/epimerase